MSDAVNHKISIFSRETLIPITFVVGIAGGVFWLTTLYTDVQFLKDKTIKIEASISQTTEKSRQDGDRILTLETQYKTILEKLQELKSLAIAKK